MSDEEREKRAAGKTLSTLLSRLRKFLLLRAQVRVQRLQDGPWRAQARILLAQCEALVPEAEAEGGEGEREGAEAPAGAPEAETAAEDGVEAAKKERQPRGDGPTAEGIGVLRQLSRAAVLAQRCACPVMLLQAVAMTHNALLGLPCAARAAADYGAFEPLIRRPEEQPPPDPPAQVSPALCRPLMKTCQ
eukprot:2906018-Pleurochrysis_carterae.AAC.1